MKIGIDASRGFETELTGTERYAFEMISRLVTLPGACLHEWVLYVRPGQKERAGGLRGDNVRVVEIPLPLLWTQLGLAARTWIDGLDALWVPAHTLPILRRGGFGVGRHLRTAVTIHGIEYEWLPAYENRLQRWYLPFSTVFAVKAADQVVAVSEFTKEQLITRLGARAEKITVVWEGYERSEKQQDKVGDVGVLTRFGLKKKSYILFVGTVQPRKNLVRLIKAYLKLNTVDYKLVICGKMGWSYADVEEIISKAGKDRVVLTGYVGEGERRELLRSALVYVQPSITEGFGLPILEAMEAGVPVAASSGGALPEVVGDAGLIFDPLNVGEMSGVLGRLIGDSGVRVKLIKQGKQRLKMFSWQRAADKIFDILTYKK